MEWLWLWHGDWTGLAAEGNLTELNWTGLLQIGMHPLGWAAGVGVPKCAGLQGTVLDCAELSACGIELSWLQVGTALC
jgi:hypothetical protein